ncbi:MAG: hypothetical protein II338_00050 [Bacteroidaceae bacterium]|nr:hypothetical protein [Bacteroidaceae bacterium]
MRMIIQRNADFPPTESPLPRCESPGSKHYDRQKEPGQAARAGKSRAFTAHLHHAASED